MTKIYGFLKRFAILYLIFIAGMYFFQRELMYYPVTTLLEPQAYGVEAEVVTLPISDKTVLTAWHMRAADGMPTILHLHGNAGNLSDRKAVFNAYHKAGFGVLGLEWRGYGSSTGEPSEEGFYNDARAAIDYLKTQGIAEFDIILYGESIGSGPAVQMATEIKARALVLEAPFTSLWARAAEIYWYLPARFLVKDRYDNLAKIAQVEELVLIFHNTGDSVVPLHHGQALYDAANEPKRIEIVEHDGHVSFDRAWVADKVKAFLQEE